MAPLSLGLCKCVQNVHRVVLTVSNSNNELAANWDLFLHLPPGLGMDSPLDPVDVEER